ncbi:hypothetical protein ACOMHN_017228 [Nucella lapillus]
MSGQVFDQVNRATLLDDAFTLVGAELLPLDVALQTLDYMKKETDYGPWKVFERVTRQVEKLIDRTHVFSDYQRFIQGLVDEPLRKIGFDLPPDNDPPIEVFLKMCLYGDRVSAYETPNCLQAVARHRYGRDVAANFVMEHFPALLKKLSSSTVAYLVDVATAHFHSNFHLVQLQFLRETYDVSGMVKTLDKITQQALDNGKWLQKNLDVIGRWLITSGPYG